MRAKGIIAYGKEIDRRKLEALAKLDGKSSSEWIIQKIRDEYQRIYGDTDPEVIV